MSASTFRRVLSRGVGKRILGYFLIAAVVPMLFTGWLAHYEFGQKAESEAARALKDDAKEYGKEILTRLQLVDSKATEFMRILADAGVDEAAKNRYLVDDFEAAWLKPDDLPVVALADFTGASRDMGEVPDVPGREGVTQLFISDEPRLFLTKSITDTASASGNVVFELKASSIWGARDNLPYSAEFCVYSEGGTKLYCTAETDSSLHAFLVEKADVRSSVFSLWSSGDEEQVVVLWQLFLEASFASSPLDIVAIQERDYALNSAQGFWHVFLPAIALVLVLVGVLSLRLIARSLVPLQHLTHAARQVSGGDLKAQVRIRTADEFESLGDAFNTMAAKLGGQIATLQAMSGIDRMILAGTKFEDVSEDVVKHLISLTNCSAAAVIARDVDAPNKGRMVSLFKGEVATDRIDLPGRLSNDWCQPRQVSLAEVESSAAPYKTRFQDYGQKFVVLIPVVLNTEIKGVLLLGFKSQFDMSHGSLGRCADLAGRFAVALSSVEREKVLYRQAHFDPLTCLPNRQLLKDRLEQHLANARMDQQSGAVLFLDLDRFKEINDMFGHSVGDLLLIQASERIVSQVRTRDTVARLGGDEFVVILPNVANESIVRATAERLLAKLGESFSIHDKDHYVSASIGIVVYPDDGDSVEMLLKNADAAMYRAKEAGRNRFEFFSERLNAESRRKISLERELRAAFHAQQLTVRYQPQFDIATGRISGAEALLRWQHAVEGHISPDEFIPLAEESGLILDLGAWVIEQACSDLSELLAQGLHPGPMSINVSARQLRDQSFVNTVMTPIRQFGIHPGFIQLEVTETTVAQNRDTATHILDELRTYGVRVAIDDFGTGYSSLSYLQQMPFDVIKIDKSFVQAIGTSVASNNICRTIIKMAAELGKKSIAEGVESREQVDFLHEGGCDYIQGHFYSKPLRREDFLTFLGKQDFHTQRRKALELR
ncbi:MAG: EAL domain-containing protein [Gammaproteobacteria bacterium]|nr:EAL domain-containing protein [Gammaproteobacteria bacterium]